MSYKLLISWLTAIILFSAVGAQASELPLLECTTKHSYGILGGYSINSKEGDTVTINLAEITKKGASGNIQFSSEAYVPFANAFQLENQQYYSNGSLSSHRFRSNYSTKSSNVLGIAYGVSGPYDARATLTYEKDAIYGIVFLDCNVL